MFSQTEVTPRFSEHARPSQRPPALARSLARRLTASLVLVEQFKGRTMDTRKNERTETTHEAILRMSDAVEDAPYALESAKVVDVKLAASCMDDEPNMLTPVEPPSKRQK